MSKYKKVIIFFTIAILIAFVFSYLCFSFVQSDLNAMNWSTTTRAGYIISLVFILIIFIPAIGMFLN